MNNLTENPAYTYKINPDLNSIDWDYVISLFYKIEWKHRKAEEIALAFKNSTTTIFVFEGDKIIAFGRVVGDGRYYAMLADIVVDPDFQGQGLGKYLVTTLNNQLENYHFVNLSAAPGADPFYKSMGWKKQTTAFIWPQGPKQLRQHCEQDEPLT
ncbi:GNAT family N-acetyltransferase [Pedobacter frigiditerrae]|uniref:GNAT family N-acetyltransferase n=1 Tax=Pedobacter frigiditerrae TaxID=2530452 RepID=A0A4R0MQG5_9SPHI|nr:GNAT family N-acetyltransferase [Pedobacter frigiditerrae]TCC89090.1 GNAT family N-acetyltransferase [Pedobacter frigiditerrae]